MKQILIIFFIALTAQLSYAQGSGMTSFDPAKDGFQFENSFKNIVISELGIVPGGLCGGMAYSALDYFYSSKPIPTQPYKPADNSTLRNYIFDRQNQSTLENADKWTELFVNPFGMRTNEFFNWGLQGYGGGRLQELKAKIDRGEPVPLGLFAGGDGGGGAHHQVLAIGYDCGRYRGDLGNYKEDLKIFIYDPDYPTETMVLRPSPTTNDYFYEGKADKKRWMTYFVDGKYHKSNPPTIASPTIASPNYPKDGKVYELILTFVTGNDDLRGGNDNVSVIIDIQGVKKEYRNVNQSNKWLRYSVHYVPLIMDKPITVSDFKSFTLSTNFGGGIKGENWNLFKFIVYAYGGNIDEYIFISFGKEKDEKEVEPLWRFTESKKTWRSITLPTFRPVSAKIPPVKPTTSKPKPNVDLTTKTKPKPQISNKDMMVIKPSAKPKHAPKSATKSKPAPVQEDVIKNLVLTLKTGGDDLRSGSRANIYILRKDGNNMYFSLNNGKGWGGNSVNTITKSPLASTKPSDIIGVRIIFKSDSGLSGDNWNLDQFDLSYTNYKGQKRSLLNRKGNPLFRFTGQKTKMELKMTPKS